jgi:hypothetical protein
MIPKDEVAASACTAPKPQAHPPRLSRTEAHPLLETAKFRPTQSGSFVLNGSCPVPGLGVQAPLLPDEVEASFVCRTTLTRRRALRDLVTSIETDPLDELIATAKNGEGAVVSSDRSSCVPPSGTLGMRHTRRVESENRFNPPPVARC